MVKVTIEENGKVVKQLEGEIIAAMAGSSIDDHQCHAETFVCGDASIACIMKFIVSGISSAIPNAIKDPAKVLAVLASAVDDIKEFMADYGKAHAEEIVKNMIDEL